MTTLSCSSPALSQLEVTTHREGFSPPLFSSSEDEVQEELDRAESEVIPPPLHTVAFKVMGTTKIAGAQEVLEEFEARDRLHQNEDVPVQIIPEPENPVDKNAIAFKCRIDSKWFKFGYAVMEVTDELHSTMHNNLIMGVTFKDIRFVCRRSKCTPGFYAAVTKKGM